MKSKNGKNSGVKAEAKTNGFHQNKNGFVNQDPGAINQEYISGHKSQNTVSQFVRKLNINSPGNDHISTIFC
jgi:hypothetical protein